MNDTKYNKIMRLSWKVIQVKESDYKVFRFTNGMTIKYTGDRKDINASCIAVKDGKIVAKAFSSKGDKGIRKTVQNNCTINDKKGRNGKLYFSK